jgi:hypothetical protein
MVWASLYGQLRHSRKKRKYRWLAVIAKTDTTINQTKEIIK